MPQSSQKSKFPGHLRNIIKLSVFVGVIIWILAEIDLERLINLLAEARIDMLVISFVLFLSLVAVAALRLHVLIKSELITFWETIRITLIGYFFNNFLPGGFGGEGYKLVAVKPSLTSWGRAIAYVSLDRLSGLIVPLVVGVVYVICLGIPNGIRFGAVPLLEYGRIWWIVGGVFVCSILSVLFLYLRNTATYSRFVGGVTSAKSALSEISTNRYAIILVLSTIGYLTQIFRFFAYMLCFNVDPGLLNLAFVMFVMYLAMLIPISFGGLGLQDGAVVVGLVSVGVGLEVAVAAGMLNRATIWLVALVGGLVFLIGNTAAADGISIN